jgi:5'-methylthioadenosine phosphorylase
MDERNEKHPPAASIGILGGSGLYEIDGLADVREVRMDTPFGEASDVFVVGTLEGLKVAFLSRHGRGHRLLPAEVNYRANVYGFKALGVERVISVNSVGSLREDIRPRDIVLADQFFDRTTRQSTFFGDGIVAHVGLGHPVCAELSQLLYDIARDLGIMVHWGGTYLCMEGPGFSTKAESRIYRSWGCDIIGMTAATEAKLCREAEICYATLCLATDYDVWHDAEESVSVELVFQNMAHNIENAKAVIKKALPRLGKAGGPASCECRRALANTIVTHPGQMPAATREKLQLLVGKYLSR